MIRFILASFVFALTAQATPKLGDYASYDATVTNNGQSFVVRIQRELIREDAANAQFLERQTVELPGQPAEATESWNPADAFLSDAFIAEALGKCSENGGALQAVTVPAGTFDTCALPYETDEEMGTAFIAKVPFGLARIDSVRKSDGLTISSLLTQFR
jgi:hypothetical protein